MKEFWTSLASLLGVLAFCQSLLQMVFPPELYLSSFVSASGSCLSLTRAVNSSATTFGLSNNDCINDVFDGAAVQWVHVVTQRQSQSFSGRPLPDEKEFWTSLASLLGVLAFCQSLLQVVFPPELYLSSFVSASGSRLSLTRAVNSSATTFGLSNNDCINDVSDGAAVQWVQVVTQRQSQSFSGRPPPDEKRGFKLRIRKRDKDLILDSYLDYIMDKANDIRRKNQERFLYNNSRGGSLDSRGHHWESVPFKHPSTFDMLAMDPERKRNIMEDLRDFAAGQAFYQRTGQAWKRGHLLYGPLGMRKSSAAMANFLGYDIYDLELTQVHSKSELLNLLVTTSSKSIIVIKDIDCLINLSNPSKVPQAATPQSYNYPGAPDAMCGGEDRNNTTITFLGLLNFPDGLRSCCGDERIFIFTTNHIEKLDPELLQSSRMDVHICMS